MALTLPETHSDVMTRLIAAVQQLPDSDATHVLSYVNYLLDRRVNNSFLKMAGIASFDKDYSPQELDEELYGLNIHE